VVFNRTIAYRDKKSCRCLAFSCAASPSFFGTVSSHTLQHQPQTVRNTVLQRKKDVLAQVTFFASARWNAPLYRPTCYATSSVLTYYEYSTAETGKVAASSAGTGTGYYPSGSALAAGNSTKLYAKQEHKRFRYAIQYYSPSPSWCADADPLFRGVSWHRADLNVKAATRSAVGENRKRVLTFQELADAVSVTKSFFGVMRVKTVFRSIPPSGYLHALHIFDITMMTMTAV
jgi:hypothetical protein